MTTLETLRLCRVVVASYSKVLNAIAVRGVSAAIPEFDSLHTLIADIDAAIAREEGK